jgi:hypothetical protein
MERKVSPLEQALEQLTAQQNKDRAEQEELVRQTSRRIESSRELLQQLGRS